VTAVGNEENENKLCGPKEQLSSTLCPHNLGFYVLDVFARPLDTLSVACYITSATPLLKVSYPCKGAWVGSITLAIGSTCILKHLRLCDDESRLMLPIYLSIMSTIPKKGNIDQAILQNVV
jgi:hypothetical protein